MAPYHSPVPPRRGFWWPFGLSPAETRVAQRLMMGESPEQAAAFLEVTIATTRWHLASLYRKTGTSRQAQLVRLLMSAPMI